MLSELHLLLLLSNVQSTKSAADRGNHRLILHILHPHLHTSSLVLHHHTHTADAVAGGIHRLAQNRQQQGDPLILQNGLRRANSKTLQLTQTNYSNTQLPPSTLFSSSQEGLIPSYND